MPPKNSKTDASGDSKKPKDQKNSVDEKQVRERKRKQRNSKMQQPAQAIQMSVRS
jgi:hypothetical protein